MNAADNPKSGNRRTRTAVCSAAVFAIVLLCGAYLRLEGLGLRSLWRDELCTWHVSRMDVVESLRWGPELTKPPLYQFLLRAITDDPRPAEQVLRIPAAVCGVLTIAAAVWLGYVAGGWAVAVALAGLIAFNPLQIYYSQEARPYSMLVLTCTLSIVFWHRLVRQGRKIDFVVSVMTMTLALYGHYLAGLTIAAAAVWWLVNWPGRAGQRQSLPFGALLLVAVLCVPLAIRYAMYRSTLFQGLEWIGPPDARAAWNVLGELTHGWQWILGVFLPSAALWGLSAAGIQPRRLVRPIGPLYRGRGEMGMLLMLWLLCAYGGLLVISWLFHPALVARYALPAAVPLLLFPMVIASRLDRRLPCVLMAAFVVGSAPVWTLREHDPGIREMVQYLNEHADPHGDLVVLTLDAAIYPGWEDSERIVFDYYPLNDVPFAELRLGRDNRTPLNDTLEDPRGLYLIVLWADPFPVLEAAGRTPLTIRFEDESYTQLSFPPYRLVRVAPTE